MLIKFYTRLVEKLTKRYRVELIEEETLYQARGFTTQPVRMIGLAIVLFLGIVGGTASLIVFTPGIRQHIPGYHNPEYSKNQEDLLDQIALMSKVIEAQDSVLLSLQRFANIEVDSLEKSIAARKDLLLNATANAMVEPDTQSVNSVAAELPVQETRVVEVEKKTASRTVLRTSFAPIPQLFFPVGSSRSIRRKFSRTESHYGIDIVASENELVKAASDGFVVISEYSEGNGHVIGIANNRYNILTFYKHNSRILKEVGDYIVAGEAVAVIGNSGENTTGPHLHFEIWHHGKPVDPMTFYTNN